MDWLKDWIGPGTVGTLFISAVVAALLARLEFLNSSYRLRKRLKEELELAEKMPEGRVKHFFYEILKEDADRYVLARGPYGAWRRRGDTIVATVLIAYWLICFFVLAILAPREDITQEQTAFLCSVGLVVVLACAFAYRTFLLRRNLRKRAERIPRMESGFIVVKEGRQGRYHR